MDAFIYFLIHNIRNLGLMVPKGLMFPISAVMVKDMVDYDASLETFSSPLLSCIDYQLDEMGKKRIENDTALFILYIYGFDEPSRSSVRLCNQNS